MLKRMLSSRSPAPVVLPARIDQKVIVVGREPHHRFFSYKIDDTGNPTEVIGRGSFGVVCYARPKDAPQEKWIVKIQEENYPRASFEEEAKRLHLCAIPTYPPLFEGGKVYIVTRFVPGTELMNDDGVAAPELANLSFAERIEAQLELALTFSHMHYQKKIIHRDVKGQNIRIFGKNLTLFDYGLAMESKAAEVDQLVPSERSGTAVYMASERWQKKASAKSDLWAAVPCLLALYGVSEPIRSRLAGRANFDVDGLFSGKASPPTTVTDLGAILREFIVARMGDVAHETRATTAVFLKFSIYLKKIVRLIELAPADVEEHWQVCATLALLATGFSIERSTEERSSAEAKTVIVLWEAQLLNPRMDTLASLNTEKKRLACRQLFDWRLLDQNRLLRIINDPIGDYCGLVELLIPLNGALESVRKLLSWVEKNGSLFSSVLQHLRSGTMTQEHLVRFVQVVTYLEGQNLIDLQRMVIPSPTLAIRNELANAGNIVQLTQDVGWSQCVLSWPSPLTQSEFQQLQQSNIYRAFVALQPVTRYQSVKTRLAQVAAVAYIGSQKTVADVINLCAQYRPLVVGAIAMPPEWSLALTNGNAREVIIMLEQRGLLTARRLATMAEPAYSESQQTIADVLNMCCARHQPLTARANSLPATWDKALTDGSYRQVLLVLEQKRLLTADRLTQLTELAYPRANKTLADVVHLYIQHQPDVIDLGMALELVLGSADYRQAILVLEQAGLLTAARMTQIMKDQQVACVLRLQQKSLLCAEYLDWINVKPRLQKILLNYPEDISIEMFNQWCEKPSLRGAMAVLVDAQILLTSLVHERLQRTVNDQLLATIVINFDGYWQDPERAAQRRVFLNAFIAEDVGLITLIHRLDTSGSNSVSLFNQLANAPDLVAHINALLTDAQLVTHVLATVNGLARVNRLSEPTLTAAVSVMYYAQTKQRLIAEHGRDYYTGRAGARVARLFSPVRLSVRIPLPQPAGVKKDAAEQMLASVADLTQESVDQGLLSHFGTPIYRAMLHGQLGALRSNLAHALAHP